MIHLLIEIVRTAYRKHVLGQSLAEQGKIPWWVERTGSSQVRRKHTWP